HPDRPALRARAARPLRCRAGRAARRHRRGRPRHDARGSAQDGAPRPSRGAHRAPRTHGHGGRGAREGDLQALLHAPHEPLARARRARRRALRRGRHAARPRARYSADGPARPLHPGRRGGRAGALSRRRHPHRGRRPGDRGGARGAVRGGAAVFVTTVRPGLLESFGPDDPRLRARTPRLVYAHVAGYGESGPERDRPAYDIGAFWSRAGIAAALMPPGGDPPYQRGALGDHVAGMTLAGGVAAALLAREKNGTGQMVTTSLLRVGVFVLGWDTSA